MGQELPPDALREERGKRTLPLRLEGVLGTQWLKPVFRQCLAKNRGETAAERRQWPHLIFAFVECLCVRAERTLQRE